MSNQQKLTILFLAANPLDTSALQLAEELREIQDALRPFRDRFVIESKWAVRIKDLRRALDEFAPTIVHFAGHGEIEGILLQDDLSQRKLVDSEALSAFFALYPKVMCVLFNACYSDELADALARVVPCVIGMNARITDKASIVFAEAFYDGIGAGKPYQLAFDGACIALRMEGLGAMVTPKINVHGKLAPNTGCHKLGTITRLTGQQFASLQEALIDSFTHQTLQMMVRTELDQNLNAIAGGADLNTIVYHLIDWAQRTGKLSALIQGALNTNPESPSLKAFVIKL